MPGHVRLCAACKKVRLSRYNKDLLCGPCTYAARSAPAEVAVWLWDSEPLRRALARMDLGAAVVILRASAGLSQQQLADLVPGWTQPTVARIENGVRDSLFDIRQLLALVDALSIPREALLPLIIGDPDVVIRQFPVDDDLKAGDVDRDRRTFNTMAVGAVTALMLPAGPAMAAAAPTRVDGAHIAYLRTCVAKLWAQDRSMGGGALLRQAVTLFTRAKRMLDESDYTEASGRQLQDVTTELGVCTGFIAIDAGEQAMARRVLSESVMLTGRDEVVTAMAYMTMALQSTMLARVSGQARFAKEALRFLDRASELARTHPSPRLHALITMRQAVAAALVGDVATADRAMATAAREMDRGPHADDPGFLAFVTPAELLGHEASVLVALGRHEEAMEVYERVLADDDLDPRNMAFYKARSAVARLGAGDVTGSVEQATAVLPVLAGPVQSMRALMEMQAVRNNRGVPDEFREEFDATADSMKAALRYEA